MNKNSQRPIQHSLFALLIILLHGSSYCLMADERATRPVVRVVFFTPADIDPPDGVSERLKSYVEYAQNFYGKWMKHWGYECKDPMAVELEDGAPKVLFVKGRFDEASGRYRQLGFESEAIESACAKYDIDPAGQVWWIFTYRGPERRGFRGGGNAKRGGRSTAIYDPMAGPLIIGRELASEEVPMNSKAAIHELGHALGLPHIGPLQKDKLGNSLMGPVVKAYLSRNPNESRTYLSKASAAMLWKHPLFSGTTQNRELTPKLDFADFNVTYDKAHDRMIVSGKVESDYVAHSVVVANESDATRSDYWRKCFAERIEQDGTFKIVVDELDQSGGQLRIVGCFNNGAVVGKDGRGLQSGFAKQYHFGNGTFSFDDGWAAPAPAKRRQNRRPFGVNRPLQQEPR